MACVIYTLYIAAWPGLLMTETMYKIHWQHRNTSTNGNSVACVAYTTHKYPYIVYGYTKPPTRVLYRIVVTYNVHNPRCRFINGVCACSCGKIEPNQKVCFIIVFLWIVTVAFGATPLPPPSKCQKSMSSSYMVMRLACFMGPKILFFIF